MWCRSKRTRRRKREEEEEEDGQDGQEEEEDDGEGDARVGVLEEVQEQVPVVEDDKWRDGKMEGQEP